ncbi:NAD-glutamate dehydrogenase [Thioflexithrix psekupsensis]|uniref:NAD-glutamate dehydrogenase n=1 Tax=Thioflexithrix psekupsensis TaxID=1570016 RepID=A0A251X780_9GAMM|nr:NAD-glutamate dehydrogenase [Thioflexithrix psekupsensis]OUD13929.1 NAD-glutamate dehydrogenase [Thioflexithrix psekupsensis]
MSLSTDDKVKELLSQLITLIQNNFPEIEAEQITGFARLFFHYVAAEDILERDNATDLYGAVISYWNFCRQFDAQSHKIRVYNPQFEQDGWQSPHTIISLMVQDMPFLVDSIRMAINRLGFTMYLIIHPVVQVRRNDKGYLIELCGAEDQDYDANQLTDLSHEAIIHVEIDHQTEAAQLTAIVHEIETTLADLKIAVSDWQAMREQLRTILHELKRNPPVIVEQQNIHEIYEFLHWLSDNHFTFLGYREYRLTQNEDGEDQLMIVANSGLGILRKNSEARPSTGFMQLPKTLRQLAYQPQLLLLTKATTRSIIHRPSYMDYVGIRLFDDNGQVIGEKRFLGLYTSVVYHCSTRQIPVVRQKVMNVFNKTGYRHQTHRGKTLLNILETYPRDELFQISENDLLKTVLGILQLQERQRIRLFVRPDTYGRFVSCIVFVPRDRYDSQIRKAMQQKLMTVFHGDNVEFNVLLSESVLAQVHFVIHTTNGNLYSDYDIKQLEKELFLITRTWKDDLFDALIEYRGEEQGTRLFRAYEDAFPVAYCEDFNARYAVYDIERMETLSAQRDLNLSLYRPITTLDNSLRLKTFHAHSHLSLSEVLPMLENMGVRVLSERSYHIQAKNRACVWIQEFGLLHDEKRELDIKQLQEDFHALFLRVWQRQIENDGFNRLVLRGRMKWREIVVFRAYYRYLKQTGFNFSQVYIEQALANHPNIARLLLDIFHIRCNPDKTVDKETRAQVLNTLVERMRELLDTVSSLDEDRILQRFYALMMATLRTNYFQKNKENEFKPYLSFKFDPAKVPDLPEPRPMFEIFVYSPRMEGVHLRGGKVARGGLRWSDRYEDFRTEVLGLVKAQRVKNAVIVPVGSKGGFVAKQLPNESTKEAMQQEAIACYETFISGLLDLTDNLVNDQLIAPPDLIRDDDDDPYLVVAADKGTASFSDIANRVAQQYQFWLGDAFASGGSAGYDHKKMGITARGAWESVKRHFRELNKNIQTEDFTVIGIGDMSGDVFGNGLLLSHHIQLIAAFNHQHIFLDPNPDPEISFKERQRLFHLPRSTWDDYDKTRLSKGGGIYSRQSKSIVLSPEARETLDIKAIALTPNELIKAILGAPVDLLWNGGIGTYVKARHESHQDVGDRANDGLRVNGGELRCRVVAEGGNLGFTQLGRIEFALAGGRINTDAVDNSGGVDCSDHEVNIKILFNGVLNHGDLTLKQRDELLAEMTQDVAHLVIRNNYLQTQAVSLSHFIAPQLLDVNARLIKKLEQKGQLVRELEFLPSEKALTERRALQCGLTRPEICVLLAYSKIDLYDQLIASELPDSPELTPLLTDYFPPLLSQRFPEAMLQHRLRREIIATELTNRIVNYAGSPFVFLLQEEMGCHAAEIARHFMAAWDIFDMSQLWSDIEALDNQIPAELQLTLLLECRKLIERTTRWLLRNRRQSSIKDNIATLKAGVQQLAHELWQLLEPNYRQLLTEKMQQWTAQHVPAALAQRVVGLASWVSALDIVEVASCANVPLFQVATVHFHLGTQLKLHWLRDQIGELPRDDRWTALSRAALRDELYRIHRELTVNLLQQFADSNTDIPQWIEQWTIAHQIPLIRVTEILTDLSRIEKPNSAMLSVALREIRGIL